ncbi:MAG: response regulator [Crocinitomicaceae bacterium]|jgi:CheY-like chemotaxis protein|nr:response regulator [Crocinitomicaceae bacterium]
MHTTLHEIVIVDDDRDTNILHEHFLKNTEMFDIVHVFDHPENVIRFTKDRLHTGHSIPALYLIDIRMPMLDGFELIDELNDLFDHETIMLRPKYVIVSGSNHSRDFEKYERAQNTLGFLSKPLEWDNMSGIFTRLTA